MEAWSKVEAGFVQPVVITRDTFGLRILDVETHPVVYKVWRQGRSSDTCFLLENRQKKGFDAPLPGAGLLIWHIDPYFSSMHNVVDLEEDSTSHLDSGFGYRPDPHYYHHHLGRSSDPLPGAWNRYRFDYYSKPNSRARNGTTTNVNVTDIQMVGDTIICDVWFGASGQEEPAAAATVPTGLRCTPNPARSEVRIQLPLLSRQTDLCIADACGRTVCRLAVPIGLEQVVWNGRDEQGRKVAPGIYFVSLAGLGSSTTRVLLSR